MFACIVRRREAAERVERDAITLISRHGADAYDGARRREWDAQDVEDEARWRRAAVANRASDLDVRADLTQPRGWPGTLTIIECDDGWRVR
jgi:hypothetical protein